MKIIGLLPMGGEGARLGLPIPKSLAPTISTGGNLVPLYKHAYDRLSEITSEIVAMYRPDSCLCVKRLASTMAEFQTTERLLPGALGQFARWVSRSIGEDTMISLAFPDSIWDLDPGASLFDVLMAMRGDGALGLFDAGADELDDVVTDDKRVVEVVTKITGAIGTVRGWGAFIVRAGAMSSFNDAEKDGPQLGRLDMGWAFLGRYVDLGTPERYVRYHDLRRTDVV